MSRTTWSVLVASAIGMVGLGATAGDAARGLQLGQQEYMQKCAVCHGESGVGAGESTEALTRTPADLVTLAKRNNGVYPAQRVWTLIDGRTLDDSVQMHREMPVWGQEYFSQALANPQNGAPDQFVNERVGALVEYVATLQVR
jgi:mono/diheme cytochrome c family protein